MEYINKTFNLFRLFFIMFLPTSLNPATTVRILNTHI